MFGGLMRRGGRGGAGGGAVASREPVFDEGYSVPGVPGTADYVYPGNNNPDVRANDFYFAAENRTLYRLNRFPSYTYPSGTWGGPPDYAFTPNLDADGNPIMITVPERFGWVEVVAIPAPAPAQAPGLKILKLLGNEVFDLAPGEQRVVAYANSVQDGSDTFVQDPANPNAVRAANIALNAHAFLRFGMTVFGNPPDGDILCELVTEAEIDPGVWQEAGFQGDRVAAVNVGSTIFFATGPQNSHPQTRYSVRLTNRSTTNFAHQVGYGALAIYSY